MSFEVGDLGGFDPNTFGDDNQESGGANYIHIRNQQRNGRKSLTTVQGLPEKYNYSKILKALKKNLNCNGNIVEDADCGKIIQVQGDKRKEIFNFFVSEGIAPKEMIKVHGV